MAFHNHKSFEGGSYLKLFVSRFGNLYHREVQYVTKLLKYCERILSKSPPGRLTVRKRSGRYYYSVVLRNQKTGAISEQYIRLGDPLLSLYVEKYCAAKLRPILQKCIRYLRSNPRKYDTDEITMQFRKFESYFGDLLPASFTTNEKLITKWAQEPFEANPFHTEDEKLYQTRNGEMVRSKDECICANMLRDYHLSYKYDAPLKLKSGRTVYPDFDIPSPVNGKEFYLEIFGRMDDPLYAAKNFNKVNEYAESGLILNDNLLVMFEYDGIPFNTALMESQIRNIILNPDR